jgi:hypothetical protein
MKNAEYNYRYSFWVNDPKNLCERLVTPDKTRTTLATVSYRRLALFGTKEKIIIKNELIGKIKDTSGLL